MEFLAVIKPIFVSVGLALAIAAARRWAPRDESKEQVEDDGKRLPDGVAGGLMGLLMVVVAVGGFYLLRAANHFWAAAEPGSLLTLYETPVIWFFLPGFAFLDWPWLMRLWLLRRFGYQWQAAQIVLEGNEKVGFDGERIMRWLNWLVVFPIAVLTLLAIPVHLAVQADRVDVWHYGHIEPESFAFADAREEYLVAGDPARHNRGYDLIVKFSDGRVLSANTVGDGGDAAPEDLVKMLIARTGLTPIDVRSSDGIPKGLRANK